jgi:hypothetical protein
LQENAPEHVDSIAVNTKEAGAKVHEHTSKSRSTPRVGPHLECDDIEIRSTPFVSAH